MYGVYEVITVRDSVRMLVGILCISTFVTNRLDSGGVWPSTGWVLSYSFREYGCFPPFMILD